MRRIRALDVLSIVRDWGRVRRLRIHLLYVFFDLPQVCFSVFRILLSMLTSRFSAYTMK